MGAFGSGRFGMGPYGVGDELLPGGFGSGLFGAGIFGVSEQQDIIVIPDAMPDIRQFLRNDPALGSLHQGRVFFQLPTTKTPKTPFVRIYRSGGGFQANSEAPIMDIRVAIEVWGRSGPDYESVRVLTNYIESVTRNLPPGTILGDNQTVSMNVNVTTSFDSPDPETGFPRIVMDSVWTCKQLVPS